ncbi:hypothetical protein [Streptobacillus canis]|uniref:hypothetical protein n=1 Tax=Streptobacillus canis TaxID=2678686 RepID=UPI0012E2E7CE|nr:hypothetical protein [Streptobacillus canis]
MNDLIDIRNLIDEILIDLKDVKSSLKYSKNWGLFDMFFGNTFSTLFKHSNLDKAKSKMELVNYKLRDLKAMFNKANVESLNINVSSFHVFADYFLDNIFVDWTMQSKIKKFYNEVDNLINKLEDMRKGLF